MRKLLKAVLPGFATQFLRRSFDTVHARGCWTRMRLPVHARGPEESGDQLRLGLLAMRFPPEVGGGAYRPSSFARYASEAGLLVTVVAPRARQQLTEAGKYLAGHIPGNVTVHRARPVAQFAFPRLLPELAGGFLELIDLYESADRAFRRRNPDVILATGPQFYTFVAGMRLAARYRCPLVLDYRDEWTECPFDFIQANDLDLKWEKRCLAAARLVVFTTRSQLDHAVETFEELDADRCAVVPNGWEPRDWREVPDHSASRADDGPRVISFVGNLGNHTPPDDFFGDLEACLADHPELRERLRFRFVGAKSPRSLERLAAFPWPELVESMDQVPKSEASRLMRESSALLLMNAPDLHRYIPGKLYEYMAAGPPLLVHGRGGEIGSIVEGLGAGWVLDIGDTEALTRALEDVVSARPGSASNNDREAWLHGHTRQAGAEKLVALIRSVAGGG